MKNLMLLSGIRKNFEFDYFEEFNEMDPSFAFNGEILLSKGVHIYDDEHTQKAWENYLIKILIEVTQEALTLVPDDELKDTREELKTMIEDWKKATDD